MQFSTLNEFLEGVKAIGRRNRIYIWGISIYGNLLGRLFNENEIPWHGYYDNFNSTKDHLLNGKYVYRSNEADSPKDAFYILSMRNYEPVKRQLLADGIQPEHIIYFDHANVLDCIEEFLKEYSVSTEKLQSFHNRHKGEKCFIIGNGPSLCIKDLEKVNETGMTSFACNLIFKCYDKTLWRPDYYFFTDEIGIRKAFSDYRVLEYASQNCKYIFSRSNGYLAKYRDKLNNLVLFKQVFCDSEEKFDFSIDCSEKVYIGHTVTYIMLQMAVYMGFKEIYLLGMDHSFSIDLDQNNRIVKKPNVENHAKILGDNSLWGLPDTNKTSRAYMSAKEYADFNEIKIYNATRGGKLEIFERVNVDEVFYS